MPIEFNPEKDRVNREKHGVSIADFAGFDSAPLTRRDDRMDYGEDRMRAFGRIGGKAYCLVYTVREATLRLISLRRAREKELDHYGE